MECSRRGRLALVVVMLSISVVPSSTAAVTETEALAIFLEQSPQARRAQAVERTVDAALRVDSRVENPDVAYQVEDAAGVRDDFLTFQQQLPVTGRHGLLQERAEVAASAAAVGAAGNLRDDAYELRRLFHEVL